jgi:glycosyltransferase involved in cell wall biosynthesis
MTAALGSWAARHHRAPLYLDIRDIFADTMNDLLPAPLALAARLPLRLIEDWTIRRAQRVNLVSRGFEGYFRARYPRTAFAWFTNGVDDEFIAAAPREVIPLPAGRLPMVLYAGNMGDGQGLHTVLPQLALGLRGRAQFKVIGDGGRRHALVAALEALRPGNVTLQSPVSRAQLLEEYRKADVLFVHLGAHAAFEKVLPSKLFEYASLGKPVLAGVRGFAARFVREEISNAAVFAPGDAAAGVVAFESLTLETRPRPEFIARHSRASIAHAMAADILSLLPGR